MHVIAMLGKEISCASCHRCSVACRLGSIELALVACIHVSEGVSQVLHGRAEFALDSLPAPFQFTAEFGLLQLTQPAVAYGMGADRTQGMPRQLASLLPGHRLLVEEFVRLHSVAFE
jgi:hypothetical protein